MHHHIFLKLQVFALRLLGRANPGVRIDRDLDCADPLPLPAGAGVWHPVEAQTLDGGEALAGPSRRGAGKVSLARRSLDHVRGLLADHDGGRVGVAPGDGGHDGRVGNSEPLDAVDP